MGSLHEISFLRVVIGLCVMSLVGTGYVATAQHAHHVATLPLTLAQKAATAALAKCQTDGYLVSVAIVDPGGNMKVLVRDDGAGPHTTDSSTKKAYTSASLRRSTNELAKLINQVPNIEGLRDMNENILILGGGLPIIIAGDIVGGIGVGGAPGAHLDEACAQAGLDALKKTS
ncbi:MAG: heme-binding protein [Nitrospirales bacterium]|nr:heme-binding protein [Nitrospirales bacterium]